MDEVFTMADSGLFFRCGRKALVELMTPCNKIPSPKSQSSSVLSSTVAATDKPALLKTIST